MMRLLEHAAQKGANAIIAMYYESEGKFKKITQVPTTSLVLLDHIPTNSSCCNVLFCSLYLEIMEGMGEVLAYGTAVVVQPIKH
jgi:uncharacterized protein YbjQ (UPF0145 family)